VTGHVPGGSTTDHGLGPDGVLYKAGRTREGSRAAASHTAAAVGEYEVCAELCARRGGDRRGELDDFEDRPDDLRAARGAPGPPAEKVADPLEPGFRVARRPRDGSTGSSSRASRRDASSRGLVLPAGIIDVHNQGTRRRSLRRKSTRSSPAPSRGRASRRGRRGRRPRLRRSSTRLRVARGTRRCDAENGLAPRSRRAFADGQPVSSPRLRTPVRPLVRRCGRPGSHFPRVDRAVAAPEAIILRQTSCRLGA